LAVGLLASACASVHPVVTAAASGASRPLPATFSVSSASFVSLATGWALGTAPCGTASCLQLWRTGDGGKTWSQRPAPPTSLSEGPGAGVREIRFADAEDGWAFQSDLWSTHDGGEHWARQSVGDVYSLEAASGVVHAVVLAGDRPQFTVLSSPVRIDGWRPSGPELDVGAGPVPRAQLVLHGAAGWLVIVNRTVVGGARLADGRWVAWPPPCTDGGGSMALAASTASDLVAVCNEGEWNDRPHEARAYRSSDGGASFTPVTTPLPVQGAGAVAAAGPGVWVVGSSDAQLRAVLLRTADGGRTWTTVHTDGQGGWLDIGFTSSEQGLAITGGPPGRLLMTVDAGRTWTARSA
jgi:hypothetical protein